MGNRGSYVLLVTISSDGYIIPSTGRYGEVVYFLIRSADLRSQIVENVAYLVVNHQKNQVRISVITDGVNEWHKVRWVPPDGQSIVRSRFGMDLTVESDARDLALRMINDFVSSLIQ